MESTWSRRAWLAAGLASLREYRVGRVEAVALQPLMVVGWDLPADPSWQRPARRVEGAVVALTATSVTVATIDGEQIAAPRDRVGSGWELLQPWRGIVVAPGTWACSSGEGGKVGWVYSVDERWTCLDLHRPYLRAEDVQLSPARLTPTDVVKGAPRPGSVHTITGAGQSAIVAIWWDGSWVTPTAWQPRPLQDVTIQRSWNLEKDPAKAVAGRGVIA